MNSSTQILYFIFLLSLISFTPELVLVSYSTFSEKCKLHFFSCPFHILLLSSTSPQSSYHLNPHSLIFFLLVIITDKERLLEKGFNLLLKMSTSEMSSGKSYCNSFKNKKFRFEVGDPTFIAPEDENEKPKIAIIKHITEDSDGELMVMCQYLYRPEDVADRYGRMWQRYDDRELFYSFHQEEIPSVCLMHPCKVHFVPSVDKVPVRTQNPGFIVLRVYDHEEQVLWWITGRDFEKHKQVEIDHLLLKTQQLLGYEMEMKEEKPEYSLEEGEIMEEEVEENQPHIHIEEDAYDIDAILAKALTGDDVRDKCLGLLFEEINCISYRASRDHHPKVVMSALVALEKACFRTRGENLAKYQQKMRQLRFNMKTTVELARRLIDGELEASEVVEMTAEELRKGRLSAEEKASKEEPEEQHMDTADIPCPRCKEKKVGLHSNILRPGRAAGYQLECLKCGKTWFSPRL